jgi:gluconokinase
MDAAIRTMIVAVMGVTGCGKSAVGHLLAERLGVPYAEGDSFHPPANVAKMAAGRPLDDADRYPWLVAVGDWIRSRVGLGGVVSCSALKYAYRDLLRAANPGLWFLHLDADPQTIAWSWSTSEDTNPSAVIIEAS